MNIALQKNCDRRKVFINILRVFVILTMVLPVTGGASAQELSPFILANPADDSITGNEWPIGAEVNLAIDDPSNGVGVDFTGTSTSVASWWSGPPTVAIFELKGMFDLQPGHMITMTGAGITKSYTVTSFAITEVNGTADVISGMATPGANIRVCSDNISGTCRTTAADLNGYWSVPADPNNFVLQPGAEGWAIEYEDDRDQTFARWYVPAPQIFANPFDNTVGARGMPEGTELTMSIDEGAYSSSAITGPASYNPNDIIAIFPMNNFDVLPGQVITVEGGGASMTYTVTEYNITSVDLEADTVSGQASPGAQLQICANLPDRCVFRYPVADSAGNWVANFGEAGPRPYEQELFDIQNGSNGWGNESDKFHNQTWTGWSAPPPPPLPYIAVSLTINWISLTNFLPNTSATISIYESQGSSTPVAELSRNTDASGNLYINGWEINWDPEPGNFVVATDGVTTKQLLLEYLTLDVFDPANDIVSGHALPGRRVDVGAGNADGEQWMNVSANQSTGIWTADYTTIGFDLAEDMWAGGHVSDEDGDVTAAHNSGPPEPPNPRFTVFPEWEWFDGLDWPDGATVAITVQDKPECELTKVSEGYFFNGGFPEGCDIVIGDTVTFTDGTTTRTHTVRSLAITEVNQENETIRGTAEAGSEVYVWPHATGEQQLATADADGNWLVNFNGIFDIRAGEYGRSEIRDESGNSTAVDWGIPMPWLIAFPDNDAVEGWEWPEGANITLTIDRAPGLAWQGTSAVTTWGDPRTYVRFEFANVFDLQAGDVVTLTDGVTVREHVVQNLSVTDVNENTESVTGTADAGAEVQVWPHGFDPDYTIQAVAGDDGTWIADFASLGFDLTKGTGGRSQIVVEGNSTAVDWQVPIPYDIYIFDTHTKQIRQLTNSPDTHEYNPRWSPDGKKIVHDTWSIDWSSHGIYITDVATGQSKSLAGAEGGSYPTWSPSGRWIAFDRGSDGDNRLFILPPTGGVPKLVTEDAFMPAWSPNSQRLAYHQPSDGSIRTVDVNGGSKTLIAANGNGPAWSPDGEWIAFERGGDVWKVRVNNNGMPLGEPIQLTSSPLWEGRPTWSNDSKTIAYHAGMGQDTDIWTIPAPGGTATWLNGAPVYGDYDANYSFNGRYIAYSSFSPDGQAARLWVAEYTYELPGGSWGAGQHTYHYEWNWSKPEPGTVIGGDREFIVSTDAPSYAGYVLLSLAGRKRGTYTETGLVCEDVDAVNPGQPTRFIAGWLTDYEMTYEEALADFDGVTVKAVWDGGQSVQMMRHEILPWASVDWAQYTCSFTEP